MFGTFLIMWTAFASVFSLMLGYSRVPYAAAETAISFAPMPSFIPNIISASLFADLGAGFRWHCHASLARPDSGLVVIRIMVAISHAGVWAVAAAFATSGVASSFPDVPLSHPRAAGGGGSHLCSLHAQPEDTGSARQSHLFEIFFSGAFLAAQGMAIFRAACSRSCGRCSPMICHVCKSHEAC